MNYSISPPNERDDNHQCYRALYSMLAGRPICPGDDCQGAIATYGASHMPHRSEYDEGYFIEVCPNEKFRKLGNFTINFCQNGADVIVIHSNTLPTEETIIDAIKDFSEW